MLGVPKHWRRFSVQIISNDKLETRVYHTYVSQKTSVIGKMNEYWRKVGNN